MWTHKRGLVQGYLGQAARTLVLLQLHIVGATRVTNNTAEMQGVIEALFWLNTCVEQGALHATNDMPTTVDSLHVTGLIEEKLVARENRVLATLLRHMWKVTKKRMRLHVRWIRGHTGDVANIIADAWMLLARARNYSLSGGDGH